MAKSPAKMEIVNENNKESDKHLDNEIVKIFGNSPPPKIGANTDLLNNEKQYSKHNLIKDVAATPPWQSSIAYTTMNNNRVSESDAEHPSQPLLEPSRDKQLPPLAGPEIDDLDGDPPKDATPYPGIDDGLLETSGPKPEGPGADNDGFGGERDPTDVLRPDDTVPTDGKVPWDEADYPYDINGLGPRFGIDDRGVSPIPGVIPDVNQYQQKKNLAQGMMDLALLSANANQLRYVLESTNSHPYYYSSLTFISLSIIIQVLVGIGLIMNSRYDVNNQKEICKADKINNMTVLGIFLITIVNVFITSFSVASPSVIQGIPQAQFGAPTLRGNST